MKKSFLLILICLLLICGCGKVPKLQNGEEAVITFAKDGEEYKISAEDLYNELKNKYGLQATVKLIDNYILEKEFASFIDEAKKSAKSNIEAYTAMFGDESKFLEYLQNNSNYSSIESYEEEVYKNLLQYHALEEYAKSLVTDKEIKNYYDNKVKGDVEIYHILITPKVTDKMTDEEKTKVEKEAQEKIEEIIKTLDESKEKDKLEVFKDLVKKYSEDKASSEKDGNLGYINYGDLDSNYDELLDNAYELKNGEYSKKLITTELGYHVIYRTNIKEKDKLEDIKDTIIENVAKDNISNDSNLALESIKYYRKLYNMKITDSELNKQYGIYLNNLANRNNNDK